MSINRTNLLAAIALSWCLVHAAVVAAAGEPAAGNKVVEGVGWGGIKIGASREELVKAFGPLEPTPGGQRTGWIARRHIDFWFDQAGEAVEVRFVKGFTSPLTSGIKNRFFRETTLGGLWHARQSGERIQLEEARIPQSRSPHVGR